MTVGKSEITPYKQACLRELVKDHVHKYIKIFVKHDWIKSPYWLIDLTAGDMDLAEETSPRIFLDIVRSYEILGNGIPINIHFFEQDSHTFHKLRINVDTWLERLSYKERKRIKPNIHLHHTNFINIANWVEMEHKWNYGFLYFDPNGIGGRRELEYLARFSRKWNAIDILMNISLTILKRCYKSGHPNHRYFNKDLQGLIKSFDKRYWWLRPPPEELNRKFMWIMLFGTNMQNYFIKRIEDFYGFNTFLGIQLLEFYNNFIQQ